MVASKHQHYYSLTLHEEITMLPTNIFTSTATIILKIINTIVPIFIMISLHFSKLSTPLFPSSLFSSVFFLQNLFIVFQSIISNSKHYHVPISVLHTFFFQKWRKRCFLCIEFHICSLKAGFHDVYFVRFCIGSLAAKGII